MIDFYTKLSPATKLVIQSFLAVLGSVLAGVATAAFQTYTQSGHFDLATIWNVSLTTFALLFGKAMHDWIPLHAQQVIQSVRDENLALHDALERSQNIQANTVKFIQPAVNKTSTPPVVVQANATLKSEDVQAIASQLATNLMSIAAGAKANMATPVPAATPEVDPYNDPLRVSMQLPAYVPPTPIPS